MAHGIRVVDDLSRLFYNLNEMSVFKAGPVITLSDKEAR
jgi:hypothetical protein